MKRLLAAGCGPVLPACRSFRNEEMGRHHNPEFTMLEWYRPCYDMYRLINEGGRSAAAGAGVPTGGKFSYQQAFQRHLEIDPLSADKAQLREVAAKLDLSNIADTEEDRDTRCSCCSPWAWSRTSAKIDQRSFIIPGDSGPLAQISPKITVAERFEVYWLKVH